MWHMKQNVVGNLVIIWDLSLHFYRHFCFTLLKVIFVREHSCNSFVFDLSLLIQFLNFFYSVLLYVIN